MAEAEGNRTLQAEILDLTGFEVRSWPELDTFRPSVERGMDRFGGPSEVQIGLHLARIWHDGLTGLLTAAKSATPPIRKLEA